MARVIDELPKRRDLKKRRVYPWDEWADGRAWVVLQGEDYRCAHHSFHAACRGHANRYGLFVETRQVMEGNEQVGVAFQFLDLNNTGNLTPRSNGERP